MYPLEKVKVRVYEELRIGIGFVRLHLKEVALCW